MSGTPWVISYLILNAVVIVLTMSLLGLGREILDLKRVKSEKEDQWPFTGVVPGDEIPEAITATAELPASGFVFLLVSPLRLAQNLSALETLCGSLGHRFSVVLCNSRVQRRDVLESCVDAQGVSISIALNAGAILGLSSNVVLYTKNNKVVDATGQLYTPTRLKERFHFVI